MKTKENWIGSIAMPLMSLWLFAKFVLMEKFLLLDFMVEGVSLESYLRYEYPTFLLYKIGVFMVLICAAYWFKAGKRMGYMIAVNLILTVWTIGLSIYFRAFGKFPSVYTFMAIGNLPDVWQSVLVLWVPAYWFFAADIPLSLMLSKPLKERMPQDRNFPIGALYLATGFLLVALIPWKLEAFARQAGDPAWRFYHEDPVLTVKNSSSLSHIAMQIGKAADGWFDRGAYGAEAGEAEAFLDAYDNGIGAGPFFGIGKGKNLILIQVESLESQVIHRNTGQGEITPFLNRMAREGLYFPHVKELVREGNSSDAEFMVNTGLYPLREGVLFYRYSDRTYPDALPRLLGEQGYTAIAAHGDRETFWNRNAVYPLLGYDEFWGIESFDRDDMLAMSSVIGLGLSDHSFFNQCAERMEALPEPFLISLITLTSHAPFKLPDEAKFRRFDALEGGAVRNYAESMAYVDGAMEAFIGKMDASGLLDRSVVVIYGDHEGLNKYASGLEEDWTNGRNLPLII